MFLFRPQREMLADAMRECVELADWEALSRHLGKVELVSVRPYPGPHALFDERIGWHTHIVMGRIADGAATPVGFTSGPVAREEAVTQ